MISKDEFKVKNIGLFWVKILILFLARIIIAAIKILRVINIEDIWSVKDVEDIDSVVILDIVQDIEYSVNIIRIIIVLHQAFLKVGISKVVARGINIVNI
jgi:hypothetical protein